MPSDRLLPVPSQVLVLLFGLAACAQAPRCYGADANVLLDAGAFSIELGANWITDGKYENLWAHFPKDVTDLEHVQKLILAVYCFRGTIPQELILGSRSRDGYHSPYDSCGEVLTCEQQTLFVGRDQRTGSEPVEFGEVEPIRVHAGGDGWMVPVELPVNVTPTTSPQPMSRGIRSVFCKGDWIVLLNYMSNGTATQTREEFAGYLRSFRWKEDPFGLKSK